MKVTKQSCRIHRASYQHCTMLGAEETGAHLNGHVFMSDCTDGSSIFRPIRRFASKTVFLGFIATCVHLSLL